MALCCVCGTECECFEVISGSQHYFFDRVDCAIQSLSAEYAYLGDEFVEAEVPEEYGRAVGSSKPTLQVQSTRHR